MLINLNDLDFQVRFSRNNPYSYAELWRKDEYAFMCTNIIGKAECSEKDRFEKSKGRKVALAKLIQEMIESGDFTMTKKVRTDIWNKYFEGHKK